MKSLFIFLWRRRWLRFLTGFTVWIVTLLALGWQAVNWYGASEWQKVLKELGKKGETLRFHDLVLDPVPTEENFCAIPLLDGLALPGDEQAEPKRLRLQALHLPQRSGNGTDNPKQPSMVTGINLGQSVDWTVWAEWFAAMNPEEKRPDGKEGASEVLSRLASGDAVFEEMKAGLDRRESRWTPEWKNREAPANFFDFFVPQYQMIQGLNQALVLRSMAASAVGDAESAHAALQMALRINRACRNDAILISALVAAIGDQLAANAIWELCRSQMGRLSDFQKLEKELVKVDYRNASLRAFRVEMAIGASSILWLKQMKNADASMSMIHNAIGDQQNGLYQWLWRWLPDGWFDLNAASLVQMELELVVLPLREKGLRSWVESTPSLDQAVRNMILSRNPAYFFTRMTVPAFLGPGDRCLYTQCLMDQALIACVLERHRLENGAYPSSLDGLKRIDGCPLPLDLMSGEEMRYELDEKGRYRMWSIGWDGKDDGGKRNTEENSSGKTGFAKRAYVGDWVWDYVND